MSSTEPSPFDGSKKIRLLEIEMHEEEYESLYKLAMTNWLMRHKQKKLPSLKTSKDLDLHLHAIGVNQDKIWLHGLNLFRHLFGNKRGLMYYNYSKKWIRVDINDLDAPYRAPHFSPRFFDINKFFANVPSFTPEEQKTINEFYLNEWTSNSIFAEYLSLYRFKLLIQRINEYTHKTQVMIDAFDKQKEQLSSDYPHLKMEEFEQRIKRFCPT